MADITIIGGGLAGSEAAYQAAIRGLSVDLCEMRPHKLTEAHKTGFMAELVCSNSLRSNNDNSAPGLLKNELSAAGSLIMEAASLFSVPAGAALAVDREQFAAYITNKLESSPNINIVRREVTALPSGVVIIATGPLTSKALSSEMEKIIGKEHLHFYDAIAPIIDGDSVNHDIVFFASRYSKGGEDYLNCPMNKDEYESFYKALTEADRVQAKEFEKEKFFEGCMPVEVMAMRGLDTLRFGPLKPVGLRDRRNDNKFHAVVQLRAENVDKSAYNMVGFQTRLKQSDQKKVFRMIPGLEDAVFLRYGSIHRNTFINSPILLNSDLTLKADKNIRLAGQITGVEGYIESTAMGLLAGIFAVGQIKGLSVVPLSPYTAHGALIGHITGSQHVNFQPSNINFGLIPPLSRKIKEKALKKEMICKRAMEEWKEFLERVH